MRQSVLLLAILAVRAQTPQNPLEKIRARMLSNLDRQPNYTCLETIERSSRLKPTDTFEPLDTLRLEVALFNGRELFSWPGSNKFEEFTVASKALNGAIGTGDFGLHANSLFAGGAAEFRYLGEMEFQGKKVIGFDYEVPQSLSEYRIRVQSASSVVAYHGKFYADPETLDVGHIEVIADKLPPELSLQKAEDKIEYATVHIGDDDFLLPSQSELALYDQNGGESHNRVQFSSCRKFSSESAVTFGGSAPSAPTEPARRFDLPEHLDVILSLEKEVDLRTAAVGDSIRARVERDVKQKGVIVIPKGAVAVGRITRFEKFADFSVLGIEFPEIEAPGVVAHMKGRLDHILCVESVTAYFYNIKGQKPPQPGEALIPMNNTQLRLVKGCFLYWRS